eukprot:9469084-Pyramimonas_sp.AAC.1
MSLHYGEAICCCNLETTLVYSELYEGLGGNLVDGLPPAPMVDLARREKLVTLGRFCAYFPGELSES